MRFGPKELVQYPPPTFCFPPKCLNRCCLVSWVPWGWGFCCFPTFVFLERFEFLLWSVYHETPHVNRQTFVVQFKNDCRFGVLRRLTSKERFVCH